MSVFQTLNVEQGVYLVFIDTESGVMISPDLQLMKTHATSFDVMTSFITSSCGLVLANEQKHKSAIKIEEYRIMLFLNASLLNSKFIVAAILFCMIFGIFYLFNYFCQLSTEFLNCSS